MIKSMVIASILAISSIASAKTINMAPITVQAHAKRHTLKFAPMVVTIKVHTSSVRRAFAGASYSPCEWFARVDGTSVQVCNGSVTMVTDGTITRNVNN